ncbi:unnamed protein product, partial [marine sediment metagenome]
PMGNIADDIATREMDWVMNAILIPTVNAEGTLWATEQASIVSPNEVMDTLKLQMYSQFKLMDDILSPSFPQRPL